MGTFLGNLLTLFTSLFSVASDEARRIRNAFIATVVSAIIIYVNHLIFNSTTWTILVAFTCDVVIIWAWFNVRRIAVMFGLGEAAEIVGVTTPQKPTNALFDLYLYVSLYIIFWVHVLCFFIPLMSLRENPLFGLFFLFGGTIYIIMYPEGKFFRKSLAWGAVFVLILMLFQLISLTGWVKLGWMEPYWALRTGDADRALTEALEADRAASDKKIAERLRIIKEKRQKGEQIDKEDRKFLEERSRGILKETFSRVFNASPVNATIPPAAPVWQATVLKREMARIADLKILPPGEGRVDVKFTLSAAELDRDVLSMYQDPAQGWQQIRLFVNGQQDPSWQWHALTGKGVARYRGIKKFLKTGENILTIQHRLEKQPVVLKNIYLDKI